jgi:hypothetical protein
MPTLLTLSLAALLAQVPPGCRESPHITGPDGLAGWTINCPIPNYDSIAATLVITRDTRELYRIDGRPLIFTWMFQDRGAHIAYSTGPLHFEELCVLADTTTGKQLASYDCFHEPIAATAPAWVKQLMQLESQRPIATPLTR